MFDNEIDFYIGNAKTDKQLAFLLVLIRVERVGFDVFDDPGPAVEGHPSFTSPTGSGNSC
jgi:hypothetical protein